MAPAMDARIKVVLHGEAGHAVEGVVDKGVQQFLGFFAINLAHGGPLRSSIFETDGMMRRRI